MLNLERSFTPGCYAITRNGNKFKMKYCSFLKDSVLCRYPVYKVVLQGVNGAEYVAFYYQRGGSIQGQHPDWDIVSIVKEMQIQTDAVQGIFVPSIPRHKVEPMEIEEPAAKIRKKGEK